MWIDFLRNAESLQTDLPARLIRSRLLATADIVITEVVQGTASQRAFDLARSGLTALPIIPIAGTDLATRAARHYRILRETIDTLIATRCIMDGHALLYGDRDFE